MDHKSPASGQRRSVLHRKWRRRRSRSHRPSAGSGARSYGKWPQVPVALNTNDDPIADLLPIFPAPSAVKRDHFTTVCCDTIRVLTLSSMSLAGSNSAHHAARGCEAAVDNEPRAIWLRDDSIRWMRSKHQFILLLLVVVSVVVVVIGADETGSGCYSSRRRRRKTTRRSVMKKFDFRPAVVCILTVESSCCCVTKAPLAHHRARDDCDKQDAKVTAAQLCCSITQQPKPMIQFEKKRSLFPCCYLHCYCYYYYYLDLSLNLNLEQKQQSRNLIIEPQQEVSESIPFSGNRRGKRDETNSHLELAACNFFACFFRRQHPSCYLILFASSLESEINKSDEQVQVRVTKKKLEKEAAASSLTLVKTRRRLEVGGVPNVTILVASCLLSRIISGCCCSQVAACYLDKEELRVTTNLFRQQLNLRRRKSQFTGCNSQRLHLAPGSYFSLGQISLPTSGRNRTNSDSDDDDDNNKLPVCCATSTDQSSCCKLESADGNWGDLLIPELERSSTKREAGSWNQREKKEKAEEGACFLKLITPVVWPLILLLLLLPLAGPKRRQRQSDTPRLPLATRILRLPKKSRAPGRDDGKKFGAAAEMEASRQVKRGRRSASLIIHPPARDTPPTSCAATSPTDYQMARAKEMVEATKVVIIMILMSFFQQLIEHWKDSGNNNNIRGGKSDAHAPINQCASSGRAPSDFRLAHYPIGCELQQPKVRPLELKFPICSSLLFGSPEMRETIIITTQFCCCATITRRATETTKLIEVPLRWLVGQLIIGLCFGLEFARDKLTASEPPISISSGADRVLDPITRTNKRSKVYARISGASCALLLACALGVAGRMIISAIIITIIIICIDCVTGAQLDGSSFSNRAPSCATTIQSEESSLMGARRAHWLWRAKGAGANWTLISRAALGCPFHCSCSFSGYCATLANLCPRRWCRRLRHSSTLNNIEPLVKVAGQRPGESWTHSSYSLGAKQAALRHNNCYYHDQHYYCHYGCRCCDLHLASGCWPLNEGQTRGEQRSGYKLVDVALCSLLSQSELGRPFGGVALNFNSSQSRKLITGPAPCGGFSTDSSPAVVSAPSGGPRPSLPIARRRRTIHFHFLWLAALLAAACSPLLTRGTSASAAAEWAGPAVGPATTTAPSIIDAAAQLPVEASREERVNHTMDSAVSISASPSSRRRHPPESLSAASPSSRRDAETGPSDLRATATTAARGDDNNDAAKQVDSSNNNNNNNHNTDTSKTDSDSKLMVISIAADNNNNNGGQMGLSQGKRDHLRGNHSLKLEQSSDELFYLFYGQNINIDRAAHLVLTSPSEAKKQEVEELGSILRRLEAAKANTKERWPTTSGFVQTTKAKPLFATQTDRNRGDDKIKLKNESTPFALRSASSSRLSPSYSLDAAVDGRPSIGAQLQKVERIERENLQLVAGREDCNNKRDISNEENHAPIDDLRAARLPKGRPLTSGQQLANDREEASESPAASSLAPATEAAETARPAEPEVDWTREKVDNKKSDLFFNSDHESPSVARQKRDSLSSSQSDVRRLIGRREALVSGRRKSRAPSRGRESRAAAAGAKRATDYRHRGSGFGGHNHHRRVASSGSSRLAALTLAASMRQPPDSAATSASSGAGKRLCPNGCSCLWKNGKHFADCSNQQAAANIQRDDAMSQNSNKDNYHASRGAGSGHLPKGLDPLLQVLNFSNNHLSQLPDSAFERLNLNNLQRIYLSNCGLESIHARAFNNLKLVVELDFGWNKLSFVPLPQMRQLTLMRRLTMRGNPLMALDELTLSGGLLHNTKAEADKTPSAAAEATATSGQQQQPAATQQDRSSSHRNQMGRLLETYPSLARYLAQVKRLERGLHSASASAVEEPANNFIIRATGKRPSGKPEGEDSNESLMLEALESALQKEAAAAGQVNEAASDEELANEELTDEDRLEDEGEDDGGGSSNLSAPVASRGSGADEYLTEELDNYELSNELLPPAKFTASAKPQQQQPPYRLSSFRRLGDHLGQLQELDFGQCKLTYIKWSALERLSQLKRLWLDGNHLSQMSGKLLMALPSGLHQLSLEDNPWTCDCRLYPLKRWLLATRTPLSAPVKCRSVGGQLVASELHPSRAQLTARHLWQPQAPNGSSPQRPSHRKSPTGSREDGAEAAGSSSPTASQTSARPNFLDQMTLGQFVCPPKALEQLSVASGGASGNGNSSELGASWPDLASVYSYLAPTLISRPPARVASGSRLSEEEEQEKEEPKDEAANATTSGGSGGFGSQPQQPPVAISQQYLFVAPAQRRREMLQVNEGERVELRCALLAYHESSLDISWLVDYNHHQQSHYHHYPSAAAPNGAHQNTHQSAAASSLSMAGDLTSGQRRAQSVGRLPVEERFIVLYESRLHRQPPANSSASARSAAGQQDEQSRSTGTNQKQLTAWTEVSLYGHRILIRESRSTESSSDNDKMGAESIFKESQIIIQSAHVEDSARYKCIAKNWAGNASVEYLLKVGGASHQQQQFSSMADPVSLSSNNNKGHFRHRDAPGAYSVGPIGKELESANKNRGSSFQQLQQQQTAGITTTLFNGNTNSPQQNSAGTWLKSSRTFQITIVVVSVLMAAVIIAFLVFCIIIYQIKPTAQRGAGQLPLPLQQQPTPLGSMATPIPTSPAANLITCPTIAKELGPLRDTGFRKISFNNFNPFERNQSQLL